MRGNCWFGIALLLLFSCSKVKKDAENVAVIGHAASGLDNPAVAYHDNSGEAINYALGQSGCDGVELDVQVSFDGTAWLYHNTELSTESNGSGCIPTVTDNYLSGLHYSSLHQEKLVRLNTLETTYLKGKNVYLDLRHFNDCAGEMLDVNKMISALSFVLTDEAWQAVSVHCITGYKLWIDPLIAAGFQVEYSVYSQQEALMSISEFPLLEGVIVKNKDFSASDVEAVHSVTKKVLIFEVRSPKNIKKAFKKRPDAILTDDLATTIMIKY